MRLRKANAANQSEHARVEASELMKLAWVLAIGAAISLPAWAQRPPSYNSLDLHLINSPKRGSYNGVSVALYELAIANYSRDDLTLVELSIFEEGTTDLRATFSGAELAVMIGRWDTPRPTGSSRLEIQSGRHALIYVTLPLTPFGSAAPTLVHRLKYTAASGRRQRSTVEGASFRVPVDSPISLGPPLRGDGWTPVYSDAWETGHRRSVYTTAGRARIPARFAIDWILVAPDGSLAKGDERAVINWYGYGREVIAVRDAKVVRAIDDTAEPTVIDPKAVVPIENASGNYVVLDLGEGRFAFYEHLKPGSIVVRTGQHVKKGQVLAAVGFTGQSTGPHLHFHVADSISTLDSDGLPYVFDEFTTVGAFASPEAFGTHAPWERRATKQVRENNFPAAFSVVAFP